MAKTNALATLRAEYHLVARRDPRTWTYDELVSVAYYGADIVSPFEWSSLATPHVVRQWTANMHALDAYVATHTVFPRAAGLSAADGEPEGLRHLVTWVDTQRRAVRVGRRCNYQRRRLETVPGYREFSHEGVWMAQFESYRLFLDTHPGAPRYRSDDAAERANASWAAAQRAAVRRGTLTEDRLALLKTLRIWG